MTYKLCGLAFEPMRKRSCAVWFASSSQDGGPLPLENKGFLYQAVESN